MTVSESCGGCSGAGENNMFLIRKNRREVCTHTVLYLQLVRATCDLQCLHTGRILPKVGASFALCETELKGIVAIVFVVAVVVVVVVIAAHVQAVLRN